MYCLEKIKAQVAKAVGIEPIFPPPEIRADLAIPVFRGKPEKLAEKIGRLKEPLIIKTEVIGKYVNLHLDKEKLARKILAEIKKTKDRYGTEKNKHKIFLEYSSPNIAKPMHIGHLRNTVIGNALKNIYRASGYKVISANYIGDWGAHFGLMLWGWLRTKNGRMDVGNLGKIYANAASSAEKNPHAKEEADKLFQKLESGNKELEKIWKKIRRVSLADFKKIYRELGIEFEIWNGEYFYKNAAKAAVNEALKKKVAEKAESGASQDPGAVVVDLNRYDLRSYLLCKSGGVTLYAARDLAAAKWRLKKYRPDKIIYVVGQEQELYLKQIFKTLGLMGYPEKKFEHAGYNIVTAGGKKVSTRAGRIIFAKDIIKEAKNRTKKINPRLPAADIKKISLGGVVYNLLSQRREKPLEFEWDKVLRLEGNTAPYIQYGYVRASSIMKKVKKLLKFKNSKLILNDAEENLVLLAAKYPIAIKEARDLNEPHIIVNYLNGLVQEFSRFYTEYPVLQAEKNVKEFRLELVAAVAQVIKNGLGLLGIETPEKM